MSTLSSCIRKAGKALDVSDADAIRALRDDLKGDGLSAQEAAVQAVISHIDDTLSERSELTGKIVAAGGVAPDVAAMPEYKPVEQKPDDKPGEQKSEAVFDKVLSPKFDPDNGGQGGMFRITDEISTANVSGVDRTIDGMKVGEPEKQAFMRHMEGRSDADEVLDRLDRLAGTPWARQTILGALSRQAMNDLIAGKEPEYDNPISHGGQTIADNIRAKGVEGVFLYMQNIDMKLQKNGKWKAKKGKRQGVIGHPEKPVNAVNGSFLDCDPSKDCATFCYATKGRYNYANSINKSELITLAVEHDPAKMAELIANEYKNTPEYLAKKALRFFDKGDISQAWVPVFAALEKLKIRAQIFSKRPEVLQQINGDFHLTMLSIDKSNIAKAKQYPDLRVAVVYDGSKAMTDWTLKNADRISVILPIKIGQRVMKKSEFAALSANPETRKRLCPIDSGKKSLGEWDCIRCDKDGGVGCFHGEVTAKILKAATLGVKGEAEISHLIEELNDVAEKLPAAERAEFLGTLRSLVSKVRSGVDTLREDTDPPVDAGSEEGAKQFDPKAEQGAGSAKVSDVSGFKVTDVESAVKGVIDGWKDGPKINIVQTMDELPPTAQAVMRDQGIDSGVAGYYERDTATITLVADGIQNKKDAQVTLAHEAVGHYGIETIMGDKINDFLREVHAAKDSDRMAKKAWEFVNKPENYGNAPEIVKAAEMVAWIAEKQPKHGLVRKIIQMIRKALRRLGFSIPFSSLDIIEALHRAKQHLKEGDTRATGNNGGLFQSAYHGTPHKFDKFSSENIGTGEGFQAYGHGLYFAGKREIAEHYRDQLSGEQIYIDGEPLGELEVNALLHESQALRTLENYRGDIDVSIKSLRSWADAVEDKPSYYLAADYLETIRDKVEIKPGSLYKVDIPEDGELLDWDAKLGEQPEGVQDSLQNAKIEFAGKFPTLELPEDSGEAIYRRFVSALGSDEAASEALKKHGIPGLRYWDDSSRIPLSRVAFDGKAVKLSTSSDPDAVAAVYNKHYGDSAEALLKYDNLEFAIPNLKTVDMSRLSEKGTRNYVVFDDERIEITDTLFRVSNPAFKKWFGDSKVVNKDGTPMVVYHGTKADFDVFTPATEREEYGNAGMYFSPEPVLSSVYARFKTGKKGSAPNVMPVYLNITNPKIIDSRSWWQKRKGESITNKQAKKPYDPATSTAFLSPEKIAKYKADGFDGVMNHNDNEFIVFDSNQIKSATGNNGEYSPDTPNILFRLGDKKPTHRKYTPGQQAAIDQGSGGNRGGTKAFKDKFKETKRRFITKFRQGMVDQFASFKDVLGNDEAWMMSQLTASSTGAVEAIIEYGHPKLDKSGAIGVDTKLKGLKESLAPLGVELDDWLWWVAGNRAARLKKEDRENLFSDDHIADLISLAEGKTKDGKNRKMLYERVRKDFEKLSAAVVQLGVDTGLVNDEEAEVWETQGFYLPFYRMLADEKDARGPRSIGNSGLVRQEAYKKLVGGKDPLQDLLGNVLMNWSHLIGASLKNQAAAKAIATAVELGIARPVHKKAASKKAIFIRENGEPVWYELDGDDGALVLDALVALNWEGLKGPSMDAARWFKRALTIGVTAAPQFKVRNLMRDTIQAIAVADMSTNIAKNLYVGFKATSKKSDAKAQLLAGGGTFGDSGYIHGADPDAIRYMIAKGIHRDTILDSRNKWKKAWDKYQDLGARLENVNRAANYVQALDKNKSLLEANFEARDHLDFARTGSWTVIRALSQTVPFLNARLQGLDKLARAGMDKAQRGQFAAVIGTYSVLSVIMYMAMKDDEDYKELEQWQRDTYHIFKMPGSDTMYFMPRPFEVGAIASMAERVAEQMFDDDVHGALFFERLGHTFAHTFAFNPVPQIFKPGLEVAMNKNWFTQRPIESMSMVMSNMSSKERKRAWTSETAIAASAGMDKILWDKVVLSPVQIEHLVRGYFGWLGSTVLAGADLLVTRPITNAPSTPAKRITEYPFIKHFVRTGPAKNTKYTTLFYERMNEINRAFADIRNAKKLGESAKQAKLLEKNRDIMGHQKLYNTSRQKLSDISSAMSEARLAPKSEMSREEKRIEIERLTLIKNSITRNVDSISAGAFYPKLAEDGYPQDNFLP